jgi:hypothetical protein
MNSQSFCNSFGMDLVALESEHEKSYFTKSCENNIEFFEEFVHVGGVFAENNVWSWISSTRKLDLDLHLDKSRQSEEENESNCLQLRKFNKVFKFSRVQCFGSKLQQFVCQKLILKDYNWTDIFGK